MMPAATNVKRFAAQIDSQRSGSPAFHDVFLMRSVSWLRSVSGGGVNLRLKSDSEV